MAPFERERARQLLKSLGVVPPYKPVWWCGRSLEELNAFPDQVRYSMGLGLRAAQGGKHHSHAKPYTTEKHKSWSIIELVEPHNTNTYRLVYTVHFPSVVFVLYAFQKKSNRGRETPKADKAMIESRYREAGGLSKTPPMELAEAVATYETEVDATKQTGQARLQSGKSKSR